MRQLLTVAALGAAVLASAQQTNLDTTISNVTLRGGVMFPIDNTVRDADKTFWSIGVDYALPRPFFAGTDAYITAEYFGRFDGRSGHLIPVTVNARFYDQGQIAGRRLYGFLGAGATYSDIGRSGWVPAIRGGFGTELGPNIVAEAQAFLGLGRVRGGARPNGIGVSLGYRF